MGEKQKAAHDKALDKAGRVFCLVATLGLIGVIVAGVVVGIVFGAVLGWSDGILAAIGMTILGGTAGLFVGLNVFCGVEAALAEVLRAFTQHRK